MNKPSKACVSRLKPLYYLTFYQHYDQPTPIEFNNILYSFRNYFACNTPDIYIDPNNSNYSRGTLRQISHIPYHMHHLVSNEDYLIVLCLSKNSAFIKEGGGLVVPYVNGVLNCYCPMYLSHERFNGAKNIGFLRNGYVRQCLREIYCLMGGVGIDIW